MNEPFHSTSRAWSWRHAVGKSGLPPMTRLVLHTLGLKMDATGGSCFPPVSELVDLTGLDKKTVLKHLEIARENGWIEVSKHGYAGQRWKRNEYTARWPGRDLQGSENPDSQDERGGAVPPRSEPAKVGEMAPQGGGNGGRKVVEQLHQDKTLPTNIPTTSPAGVGAGQICREDLSEDEDEAKLERRVRLLEFGKNGNQWPNAGLRSNRTALRAMRKLTSEERDLAEERRDLYLDLCKQQNMTPLWLSSYLGEKKFLDIQPTQVRAPAGNPSEITVAPLGPLWAAMRAMSLLAGPKLIGMPNDLRDTVMQMFETHRKASESRALAYLQGKHIVLTASGDLVFPEQFEREERRRRIRDGGFPEVNRLHQLAKSRESGTAPSHYAALAELCEPVPVGSDVFQAWRDHDDTAGWPFVPDPGSFPVVWFPKGGPAGLPAFEAALRAILDKGRSDEHAA